MRIAVFGSGGVGGYFGGRLAQAGEEIIFIAHGAHLAAMRESGLRVESVRGDFTIFPARTESDPAAVGPVDVVLVGVKAWQVPEAAEAMRPLVGSDTLVVPLQNGVDAPAQLAAALDGAPGEPPHAIGGLCRIVSLVAAPGLIRHPGMDPSIAFNRLDGLPDERVERLRAAFARAQGLAVEVPADIQAALWGKFIFIAAFSGMAALTRVPAGPLRRLPETRRLLEAAVAEIEAVGRAQGVRLPADTAARVLAAIDALPEDATASMQRDIMEGRPSELESQNGAVARLGQAGGVSVPVNEMIYACLLPQERRAAGQV